jgi:hypothetical protein
VIGSDQKLSKEPSQSSIEDLSKKMDRILERLSYLEGIMMGNPDAEALSTTLKLMRAGIGAYGEPLKVAARLKNAERILRDATIAKDDISRCIIQSLALRESLNISAITREVESMRGKASRRIVRDRLLSMVERGLVKKVEGKVPKYQMREE